MHSGANSRDFTPGPDNPLGRWDASWHVLIGQLRKREVRLPELAELCVRAINRPYGSGATRRQHLTQDAEASANVAELVGRLKARLKLPEPSGAVDAGLTELATYLLDEHRALVRFHIAQLEARLKALNTQPTLTREDQCSSTPISE